MRDGRRVDGALYRPSILAGWLTCTLGLALDRKISLVRGEHKRTRERAPTSFLPSSFTRTSMASCRAQARVGVELVDSLCCFHLEVDERLMEEERGQRLRLSLLDDLQELQGRASCNPNPGHPASSTTTTTTTNGDAFQTRLYHFRRLKDSVPLELKRLLTFALLDRTVQEN